MAELYLLMQLKIDEYHLQGKIQNVTIRREGEKEWLPIFEINDPTIKKDPIHCAIRVRTKSKVRTWADPRLLVNFLMEHYQLEECHLIFPHDDNSATNGEKNDSKHAR